MDVCYGSLRLISVFWGSIELLFSRTPGPLHFLNILNMYFFCVECNNVKFSKRVNKEKQNFDDLFGVLVRARRFFIYFQICMSGWATGYSYRCQPVDYSDNPMAMRVSCVNYYARNTFTYSLTFTTFSVCLPNLTSINYFTFAGLAILVQPFNFLTVLFFNTLCFTH